MSRFTIAQAALDKAKAAYEAANFGDARGALGAAKKKAAKQVLDLAGAEYDAALKEETDAKLAAEKIRLGSELSALDAANAAKQADAVAKFNAARSLSDSLKTQLAAKDVEINMKKSLIVKREATKSAQSAADAAIKQVKGMAEAVAKIDSKNPQFRINALTLKNAISDAAKKCDAVTAAANNSSDKDVALKYSDFSSQYAGQLKKWGNF